MVLWMIDLFVSAVIVVGVLVILSKTVREEKKYKEIKAADRRIKRELEKKVRWGSISG